MSWSRNWKKGIVGAMAISMLAACSANDSTNGTGSEEVDYNKLTLEQVEEKAKGRRPSQFSWDARYLGKLGGNLGRIKYRIWIKTF